MEKLRSLLQQQKKWPRPRDLYDLWYILCHSGEQFNWDELSPMFKEKCRIRNIKPDLAAITSTNLREWNKNAWRDRLGPMLIELPDFNIVWKDWIDTFHRLIGKYK